MKQLDHTFGVGSKMFCGDLCDILAVWRQKQLNQDLYGKLYIKIGEPIINLLWFLPQDIRDATTNSIRLKRTQSNV